MQPPGTITIKQLAEQLGLTPQQTQKYTYDPDFPKPVFYMYVGYRNNKKTRVFNKMAVDNFFAKNPPKQLVKRERSTKQHPPRKNANFNQLAFNFLTKPRRQGVTSHLTGG